MPGASSALLPTLTPVLPFVLLDDARAADAAPARLYRNPVRSLTADGPQDVEALLDALAAAQSEGLHAAGWLGYEAGLALDPRTARLTAPPGRLGWFGLFADYQEIAPDAVTALLPDPAGAWLGALVPDISHADYATAFDRVIALIEAGDIYQANLTFRTRTAFAGGPLALYAALRSRAKAGYGALVFDGEDWLLSFSPELFFALRDRRVTAKPMKGTAARLADRAADADAAARLAADPKQRAENLMIVDLLRNDLARVAVPGSVAVPRLFTVESYPTVHQMTSTVTAQLTPGAGAIDLLRAAFPCGSITGAPKLRAMEVIAEVEASPRGPYCGSIGRIDAPKPDGSIDAAFNVAIRTLHIRDSHLRAGRGEASLGLGSGIVADSRCADEWAECLAKGEYARVEHRFDLIETMRFEPAEGVLRLELHLERMKRSALALGFVFDRHAARNALHAASFHLDAPARLRLLLSASGATAIEAVPAPAPVAEWRVALAPMPYPAEDIRLSHKTTDRAAYRAALAGSGADEVLFQAADGALTEGSYSSLFVEGPDNRLLTPRLESGLLPGVLRESLIAEGRAIEARLTVEDLTRPFFLGNSLRGLVPGRLLT